MMRLLMILTLLALPLAAQGRGQLAYAEIGPSQGMIAAWCFGLSQDASGRLWVASDKGTFSGDFQHFMRVPGPAAAIPSSGILHLADGTLLVSTDQGLASLKEGQLVLTPLGLPVAPVTCLRRGPGGQLWVVCQDRPWRGTFPGGFEPAPGWPAGMRADLLEAQPDGHVTVASGQTLMRFDGSRGGWEPLPAPEVAAAPVIGLAEDARGTLWMRNRSFLFGLHQGRQDWVRVDDFRPGSARWMFNRAEDGRVWVSHNRGLLGLLGAENPVRHANHPQAPGVNLRWAMLDHEGALWLAGAGLFRPLGGGRVQTYDQAHGLDSPSAWRLMRDSRGRMWVSTNTGLNVSVGDRWRTLPTYDMSDLAEGPDGWIWGSPRTPDIGLVRIHPDTFRVEEIPFPYGHGASITFSRGLFRRGQAMWVSGVPGVWSVERKGQGWHWENHCPEVSPEKRLAMHVDEADRLWMATNEGLHAWGGGRHHFLAVKHLTTARLLTSTPDGRVWMGFWTEPLLRAYRLEPGGIVEVSAFPAEKLQGTQGIQGGRLFFLAPEGHQALWLLSTQGAYRLDLARGEVEPWTPREGMPSKSCNQDSYCCDSNGDIWIGTVGGLARLNRPDGGIPLPAPLVGRVLVDARPLETSAIRFWPARSGLELFAGVPSTHHLGRVGLEGSLDGKVWQPLSEGRMLLMGLAPGRHELRLRARMKDGRVGPVTLVPFQALPLWWQTWWARGLGVSSLVGVAWLVAAWRTRQLRWRNLLLTSQIAVATRDLQDQAEELEAQARELERGNRRLTQLNEDKTRMLGIAAHDLRNPIGTIQLLAQMVEEDTAEDGTRDAVQRIQRQTRGLMDLLQALLDTSRIDAGPLVLDRTSVELQELCTTVAEAHRERAQAKGLGIQVEGGSCQVLADGLFLRQILDNLVSNALKFMPPGPPCRVVRLRVLEDGLEVADEGPGFMEEDRARVFGRFQRLSARPTCGESSTGLGLSIVKELVEAMGGTISLEPGPGARFRIRFPAA